MRLTCTRVVDSASIGDVTHSKLWVRSSIFLWPSQIPNGKGVSDKNLTQNTRPSPRGRA